MGREPGLAKAWEPEDERECEQRHSSHQSIKCSNSNEEQPILERKTEEKDIVQILNGNEIKLSDSKC